MLSLHGKNGDYCVLFDVHEDVVELDSPMNPQLAHVFQIKSDASSSWTVHGLTKRERNKSSNFEKPSILGKLYQNYLSFPGFIASMSFVSNAPFSIKLADGTSCNDHESIRVNDIHSTDLSTVNAKLATEHNVPDPPVGLAVTHLVRTSLSVTDHERHTEGIVSSFLQTRGDGTIPPAPFHRTLRSEIRRRNDKETAASSFAELAKTKGISRADLQRMLDSIPSDRRMTELIAVISQQLIKEETNVRAQSMLIAEVRSYLAKRLDVTNFLLSDARTRVAIEIAKLPDEVFSSSSPIADVVARVSSIQSPEFVSVSQKYSPTFLSAIIAVAIYEQHEFSPLDTQSTEEAA
jgi:hypothetical protein